MDLNHFFGTTLASGVLPVEIVAVVHESSTPFAVKLADFNVQNVSFGNNLSATPIVAIGEQPGFNPPRLTLQNSSFDNDLYTLPVVYVGIGSHPPR